MDNTQQLLFIIYNVRFISMCQSQRILDFYRRESISALLFTVIYGCPVSTSFSVDVEIVNEDEIISGQPLKASSLLRLVFISMIYVLKYKLTWSNSVIATFLREFSINILI